MQKIIIVFLLMILSILWLSACSTEMAYEGAVLRNADGTIAVTLIDRNNAWRGGIIGGALGAAVNGGVTEISTRASREAVRERKPVAYQSIDGFQRVEAYPLGDGSRPNCRLVREQIFQDGKTVRDEMRDICP